MGEKIQLTAADGFELDAYLARPDGDVRGGVVVIQEIFGVNRHIREVTDGFAADGFLAIAPAIFDRAGERDIELGYEGDDMAAGLAIARGQLEMDNTLKDLQAAIDYAGQAGHVGVVGYCFGGLMTWMCAGRSSGLTCAVGYYGGGIAGALDTGPQVPTLLHFGDQDAHIPLTDVEKVKSAYPEVEVHVYEADHGFNCDHRPSFNAEAAVAARKRTMAFFEANL